MQSTAPPSNAELLRAHLLRLARNHAPELIERLRPRAGSEGVAELLQRVASGTPLRVVRAGSLEELARLGPHAVCLGPGDTSVFITPERGAVSQVEVAPGAPAEPVSAEALRVLFPCTAILPPAQAGPVPTESTAPATGWLGAYLRLAAQLLALATPIAMMLIIDRVVSHGAANTLLVLVAGVALLTVFQYLFSAAASVHGVRESEALALPERHHIFMALLASPEAGRWSGPAWDVLQGQADQAAHAAEGRVQCLADGVFVALLSVLMAAFSVALLAVVYAFVPAYLLLSLWSARRVAEGAARLGGYRSELSVRYQEAASAGDTVPALDLAPVLGSAWRRLDRRLAGLRYRQRLLERLSAQGLEFLQRLSLLVVMLLGVSLVIRGAMTLGQYIAFNLLAMQLTPPLLRITAFHRARSEQRARREAGERLFEALSSRPWPAGGRVRFPAQHALVLEAESIRLPGSPAPLHLQVRSGEWLGITGASGCGKTTLLRMLAGLAEPAPGAVRINGVPLSRLERASMARALRLVPQQGVLFSGSLADNIALGDAAATPEAVFEAARLAGLMPLLESLPDHLDTRVSPAGTLLSGGERQRVVLARALLSRPSILLLDEATSALDASSERELMTALKRFLPQSAVLLVSHRQGSLALAGRVVDLSAAVAGPGTARHRTALRPVVGAQPADTRR